MLKLDNRQKTMLVDDVETSLINYFKEQNLCPGSKIPSEMALANALGIGRATLREALSRFKMNGMIVSRPKIGMVLSEPSLFGGLKSCMNPLMMGREMLRNILELRVALEIGISNNIFRNITQEGIRELEEIVDISQILGNNRYTPVNEHQFHTKLYEITGNRYITEFQEIIYPVLNFVKERYHDRLEPIEQELASTDRLVSHRDLLEFIKNGDLAGYKTAIENHFKLYTIYLERYKD